MENSGHDKVESNGLTPQSKVEGEKVPVEAPKSPFASQKSPEVPTAPNDSPTENEAASEIDLSVSGDQSKTPHQSSPAQPDPEVSKSTKGNVSFIVIHAKTKYYVEFPLGDTVEQLKKHLHSLTGVPQKLQKVMYKGGLAKDEKTLEEIGVVTDAKLMLVGSKLNDLIPVLSATSTTNQADDKPSSSEKEPLCKQKNHRKVLERGVPEDVMPGILNAKETLPPFPLSGMLNKAGGKLRLTFKLEMDQLWIGTKERTDKIPMTSIKSIISEPIEGHEQYHIMGIQLGTTEGSRYWVYWVPAQYIDSIKEAVLGPSREF